MVKTKAHQKENALKELFWALHFKKDTKTLLKGIRKELESKYM